MSGSAGCGIAQAGAPLPHAVAEPSWLWSEFGVDPYNWLARQLGGSFRVSFHGDSGLWVSVAWV